MTYGRRCYRQHPARSPNAAVVHDGVKDPKQIQVNHAHLDGTSIGAVSAFFGLLFRSASHGLGQKISSRQTKPPLPVGGYT